MTNDDETTAAEKDALAYVDALKAQGYHALPACTALIMELHGESKEEIARMLMVSKTKEGKRKIAEIMREA
jgi:hypothetical protein